MTDRVYATIVVDPPWQYARGFLTGPGEWGRASGANGAAYKPRPLPYPSMTVEEIASLPIQSLAHPTGCNVFLWTTNRYLRPAYDVLDAWGAKFSQIVVWAKPGGSQPPTPRFALAPNSAEFLLFGRIKAGQKIHPSWATSVMSVPRPGGHSHKPEVFLDLIEQSSPSPWLEMFARRNRLGWDTWGNEALKHVEMPA